LKAVQIGRPHWLWVIVGKAVQSLHARTTPVEEHNRKLRGGLMGTIDVSVTVEPQHLRALEHANKVRLARAELKRRIAAGDVRVPDVVLESPWEARSMELSELLMSQKRWGRERCRRLLLALGIPENKQIGTLTERQRSALAAMLAAAPAERRAQAAAQPLPLRAVAAA
jgi:hypothetical protein